MGVGVGGHDATNFSHISKDAQENSTSFNTTVIIGDYREKWCCMKNRPKMEITGVKIAWVAVKSTKYPFKYKTAVLKSN